MADIWDLYIRLPIDDSKCSYFYTDNDSFDNENQTWLILLILIL